MQLRTALLFAIQLHWGVLVKVIVCVALRLVWRWVAEMVHSDVGLTMTVIVIRLEVQVDMGHILVNLRVLHLLRVVFFSVGHFLINMRLLLCPCAIGTQRL